MERIVRTGLLYDFYGGLLTDKQRKTMELYYLENWSLAEIATQEAVSRQAVHDLLHRCERMMEEYESKLGLMGRFVKQQAILESITQKISKILADFPQDRPGFRELSEVTEELSRLQDSENE